MCIQIDKGTIPPEVGPFFEREAQRKTKIRKKKKRRKKSRSLSKNGANAGVLSSSSSDSLDSDSQDAVFVVLGDSENKEEKRQPKNIGGKRKRRVLSNTENVNKMATDPQTLSPKVPVHFTQDFTRCKEGISSQSLPSLVTTEGCFIPIERTSNCD